jgi:hypothetical protein
LTRLDRPEVYATIRAAGEEFNVSPIMRDRCEGGDAGFFGEVRGWSYFRDEVGALWFLSLVILVINMAFVCPLADSLLRGI